MRFRDFLLKQVLAPTDYLVGYDADGNYVRISKDDLRTSLGVSTVSAQSITVQYSADGSTWHDSYITDDMYMRIKVGSGSWSGSIRIAVSAYDIWKDANGGSGTVSEFLTAINGEPGEDADLTNVSLSDLGGYNEFLVSVASAINNTKQTIISEVTDALQNTVYNQFVDLNLSEIGEIKTLNQDDYITIVTADGLKKVKISNLIANVTVHTASTKSLESVVKEQRRIISLEGDQNESNVDFTTSTAFVMGTSDLYFNGQRLIAATDYLENNSYSITFLTQIPRSTDRIIFLAVLQ